MYISITKINPEKHNLKILIGSAVIVDKDIDSVIDYQDLSAIETSCARLMALRSDRAITIRSINEATYNVSIDPINGIINVSDFSSFQDMFWNAQQMLTGLFEIDPSLDTVEGMSAYELEAMSFIENASKSSKDEERRQEEAMQDFEEMTKSKIPTPHVKLEPPTMHELAMSKIQILREFGHKKKHRK